VYLITILFRLCLALIFGIAGISKLRKGLPASTKTLTDFGLPSALATPGALLLPGIELVTALLLVSTPSGWTGSILALALFVIFNAAIAMNLFLGKTPQCNCFGQLHSKPIGWSTFARNSIPLSLAAWLVWVLPNYRDASLKSSLASFSSMEIAGALVILVLFALITSLGFLLLHVLKQHGRLLLRIEALEKSTGAGIPLPPRAAPALQGLSVGSKAPVFQLPNVHGTMLGLGDFLTKGKASLLIFTDPNCGPCLSLLPQVASWQQQLGSTLSVVLISSGSVAVNLAKAQEFGLQNVLVEKKRSVAESYMAFGTPSAVLIRPDGSIGSFLASGSAAISQLIEYKAWMQAEYGALLKVLGHPLPPPTPDPTPALGSLAPEFSLKDLDGLSVSSSSFRGRTTVLLFWNPQCGFCQRMLPQLKAWESRKPSGAPRLVLSSSGTRELNAAMGLEATMLLDEKFEVGNLYGCRGTPSAIGIDSQGRIASAYVVGEPAAMGLLSSVDQPDIQVSLGAPLRTKAG
jgi:peroxiredoxin/uncharacterized membrane protein YphA (DoxX/SURF4 family)